MTAPSPRRLDVDHVGDVTVVRFTDKRILDEQTIQTIREQLFGLTTGGQFSDSAENLRAANRPRFSLRINDLLPPAPHPFLVAPTAFE